MMRPVLKSCSICSSRSMTCSKATQRPFSTKRHNPPESCLPGRPGITFLQSATMKLPGIGGGGREHASAWRLAGAPGVPMVYVAPGNGGTARASQVRNTALTDINELIAFAQQEKVAYTVVGPEAPLA